MDLRPFDAELLAAYLRHLGLERAPGTPSPADLTELHHAQLDRVPYENLEIQLGRPTGIDPHESARRILTGRGGYCYHLNGSFAGLLVSLGYDVTLARGAVPAAGADGRWWGNHLVVLVRFGTETWVADVGMGDGFRDPVPLVEGSVYQLPFRYRLRHVGGPLWRFHHDVTATTEGYDLDVTPVGLASYAAMHTFLSTSPESGFVQKLVVQRRHHAHTLTLRGCVLTRADADGKSARDVEKESEWLDLLGGEFGLRLDGFAPGALSALWIRVRTTHEAWVRAGRP
ncbi:MAG TPA: arylamine N-acetyltransferase [Actinopolymorphaceae bacterium]|nr:arylamine N-acetyltransferase [Actinopolymorphaceae bacterium]